MSLIIVSLLIMVVFLLFNIFLGSSPLGVSYDFVIDTSQTLNGTATDVGISGADFQFYIDPTLGAIVIFATVIGILALWGITVVGSGLATANSLGWVSVYLGLWALLSIFGSAFIQSVNFMGWLIYLGITLMYVVGVVIQLSSAGG